MIKKLTILAGLIASGFIAIGQKPTAETPLYAKALEKKTSSMDLTSVDVVKKFYNNAGEEVRSLDNAKFIRISKKNAKGLWETNEFFADGYLRMEGSYSNLKEEVKHGKFRYYRQNGKMDYEGIFNEDTPDGEWRFYFPNGQLSGIEYYEKGLCTRKTYWNEDGSSLMDVKQAEKMLPSFEGGQEKLNDYIKRNIVYPADANKSKLSGKVVVSFWVDEEGKISEPKIEESLHQSLDNQVLKLVSTMPKWKPARQHNRPHKQMYVLPVTFGYY
ncbi:MAG: TonB family protein [Spirosomaceae bacterium]|jgi:TonB family protein|nr:TonB family protein [Spirosomataceae bacterium]